MNPSVVIKRLFLLVLIIQITACKQAGETATGSGPEASVQSPAVSAATVYMTAKESENRLAEIGKIEFTPFDQPDEHFPTIILDPGKTFQTIVGFGGALTDASAETLAKLPAEKREEILTAYFDKDKGIGYNLCRTHINSCDFSSGSYAYTEVDGDIGLEHFSIEHDLKYRIPLIKDAMKLAGKDFKLFASPWSPPAWMKTNNHMLRGGKLKPEYYQVWADYFVKFIRSYEKEGIPVWGVTVQNEPMAVQTWESCIYTAGEERDFVKNNLGPTLVENNMEDVKVIIWDHNRGIMNQRAEVVYDDPEASKYVWGTGFHWYTGDHFENVKLHAEAFPDKKLIFTEGCVYPFDMENIYLWHWGERYAESIIHDLNNSTVGWVDWNIVLDETGGPNHVSNFCLAPVIGDTRKGEVHYMNSYYYMGHFSKFIRSGAKRIVCASNNDDLLATAFINPDGSISTVIMNATDRDMETRVWIEGKAANMFLPGHSIATVVLN
ncbi:MAG: glycoside hydrolase family 30 protein [Bacteroidales bacterium]|nr:glycoside hydrolase family 30 protein [Bacteroidales bacterium]MBN2699752.1 glycoside hydrolase family 30 protein [Bacteroidales bacterium]